MLFEDSTIVWMLLLFELTISLVLILGSRSQPFPTPSRRFGLLLLLIFSLLLLGQTAPRPTGVEGHLAILSGLGSVGILVGIHHMLRTRREVLVAPMSGFLFCVGVTGLIVQTWDDLNRLEHWAGFLAIVVLFGGQVWLVFRGLLIGRLPLAWSQAGMVALHRGQIHGRHGAIECFEKGWDADEEHLNPMAYAALWKINNFIKDAEKSAYWKTLFLESGGAESVAEEWLDAIDGCLISIGPSPESE